MNFKSDISEIQKTKLVIMHRMVGFIFKHFQSVYSALSRRIFPNLSYPTCFAKAYCHNNIESARKPPAIKSAYTTQVNTHTNTHTCTLLHSIISIDTIVQCPKLCDAHESNIYNTFQVVAASRRVNEMI